MSFDRRKPCWILALCAAAWAAAGARAAAPDFTGVWQVVGSHPALRPISGAVPFTPDAAAAYAKTQTAAKAGDLSWDTSQSCIPPGIPRTLAIKQPFEILQEPQVVTFLFQIQRLYRYIYLNPAQPVNDDPTFMGQPFGHWDNATLVAESDNFKTGTFLDDEGMPHSDQLKVTEQWSLKNPNTLVDRIHVDDAKTFTKAWDAALTFRRLHGVEIAEDICVDRMIAAGKAK